MAASIPVVLPSNQTAIPTSQSGTWTVQPGNTPNTTAWKVDGSAVTQPVSIASMPSTPVTGTFWQATQPVSLASAPTTAVTGTFWQATQPVSLASAPTTPASQSGTWTVQPGNTANTTAWLVTEEKAATATLSNVASSATNVTILASNASRKQATVFNDSTQILYLKFGTTASNTSYTVQLAAGAYYELPGVRVYTGEIDGLWASANGNARVTELT